MFVEMGEIVNAVGLRGEVKVLVTGNFDERVLRSGYLRLRDPRIGGSEGRPVRCRRHRWKGNTVVVDLEEIDDREAAEAAIGRSLGFRAADYDEPGFPRGEGHAPFVYLDLEVVTTGGVKVGVVDDVMTLPANWVLRVLVSEGAPDEREILIPVIETVVREVDRVGGRVVIEPMPGLLEGGEANEPPPERA